LASVGNHKIRYLQTSNDLKHLPNIINITIVIGVMQLEDRFQYSYHPHRW